MPCCVLAAVLAFATAQAEGDPAIRLELKPRVCTLGADDTQCRTAVQASWHAAQPESLCLIIVGRPEIKR